MSTKHLSSINLTQGTANPAAASTGDLFYNTTTPAVNVYNGTTWVAVGGSTAGLASLTATQTFTGTQTVVAPTAGVTGITVKGATPVTATVTSAVGNGSTVVYQAVNSFAVGSTVAVTGLTTTTGSSLNFSNQIITAATSTQFTITLAATGTSVATQAGTATVTQGANFQEWQTDSGTVVASIGPGGNNNSNKASATFIPSASFSRGVIIRGQSGQGGNLQEWQSSTNTALASVSGAGAITAASVSTTGAVTASNLSTFSLGVIATADGNNPNAGVIINGASGANALEIYAPGASYPSGAAVAYVNATGTLTAAGISTSNTSTKPAVFMGNAGTLTGTSYYNQGNFEFDGTRLYISDAQLFDGRQIVLASQFGLLATSASVASGGQFFTATQRPGIVGGRYYKVSYLLSYQKVTAGTLTFSFTNSLGGNFTNLQMTQRTYLQGGALLSESNIFATASATTTSTATASMTASANYFTVIEGYVVYSGTSSTMTRLQMLVTDSAGTVTSLIGSMFELTDMGSINSGNIA